MSQAIAENVFSQKITAIATEDIVGILVGAFLLYYTKNNPSLRLILGLAFVILTFVGIKNTMVETIASIVMVDLIASLFAKKVEQYLPS